MSPLIIGAIVVMVLGIILLTATSSGKGEKRKNYIEALAGFLESQAEALEGYKNSYRIRFVYKGKEFIFEDIEEEESRGQIFHKGFLRTPLGLDLSLSFTERSRSSIRENFQSITDAVNPWSQNVGKVVLPAKLKEFTAFTNNPAFVNKLLAEDAVARVFEQYKNRDSRGHPLLSLEIRDSILVLMFHPQVGLKPSFFDLEHNVASIDDHLTGVLIVINRIKEIQEEEK